MLRKSKTPAVLFDLDGTLIDSVPDIQAAANLVLSEDGRPPLDRDAVAGMVGNGARTLMQRVYAATGGAPPDAAGLDRLRDRFIAHYSRAPAALTTIFPGVRETLEVLHAQGLPLAIVTNKPIGPTHDLLSQMDLARYFPVVIGGGSTPVLKPDPLPLREAHRQLAPTLPVVMVGDSTNDSAAARAAGMPCICVTFGYRHCSPDDLGADALIDHFSQLPQALDRLFPA